MEDLNRPIKILNDFKLKTNDLQLKKEIDKSIKLINQGLEFEREYEEYKASKNVLNQLNNHSANSVLSSASKWQKLAEDEIPF